MARPAKSKSVPKTSSKKAYTTPNVDVDFTAPAPTPMVAEENNWEMKDRVYVLRRGLSPLTYTLKGTGIYWFDEEAGYERELKHTSNQRTPFVDEMSGDQRLAHIVFEDGTLFVPKNKQPLQKLLSLYHPELGKIYEEFDSVKVATDEIDTIELEIEALTTASTLDLDMAEAVMRVEVGSKVNEMSSKELKRDMLILAKRKPRLFLSLVNDDNVHLRNVGIKAVEMKMIRLSADQRTFTWANNGRKLCTVPFNEHPYSALAAWFKTDEGMEVFSAIEKQLG